LGLWLGLPARDERQTHRRTTDGSHECVHGHNVPLSVCSAASATRYRTSPSS
jgi:hypothetical protein